MSPGGLNGETLPPYRIGLIFAISRESSGKLECLTSVIRDDHAKYGDTEYVTFSRVYVKVV